MFLIERMFPSTPVFFLLTMNVYFYISNIEMLPTLIDLLSASYRFDLSFIDIVSAWFFVHRRIDFSFIDILSVSFFVYRYLIDLIFCLSISDRLDFCVIYIGPTWFFVYRHCIDLIFACIDAGPTWYLRLSASYRFDFSCIDILSIWFSRLSTSYRFDLCVLGPNWFFIYRYRTTLIILWAISGRLDSECIDINYRTRFSMLVRYSILQ